jgi:GT2 family glycosyltransferase
LYRRHRAGVSALVGYEVAFCRDAPVLHRGGATGSHFDANAKPALLERNAYYVIKNYRDDAFAGILPAALVS